MKNGISLFDENGRHITPGEKLNNSGEATLYAHGDVDGMLIKLHHNPDEAMRQKLAVISKCAPSDASLHPWHRNFAWPISAIYNASGDAVGCIIPMVKGARSMTTLSNPKQRARRAAEMDWHYLHAVAANIAYLFDRLHDQRIVVGDVKPENILVDDRALATLIDCDSVQFRDLRGTVHLCPVGSEGFTAPEWIGRKFSEGPRDRSSDLFGLAVLIYQLLIGAHPWNGEWMGIGDPPPRDHLIRYGDWPYRPGARLRPVPGMTPPDVLAPDLVDLFRTAFIAGHKDPSARPDASTWYEALCTALADLDFCRDHTHHHHDPSIAECPWCAKVAAGLPDPFPAPATPRDPFASLVLAFERALARGDTRMAAELWRENSVLARHPAASRLSDCMRDLTDAVDALDKLAELLASTRRDSPGALASFVEDHPILKEQRFFIHETLEGRKVSSVAAEIEAAAVEIPTPILTEVNPVSSILDTSIVPTVSLDTDPVPLMGDREPVSISYRIEAGWIGLRPARLIVTADRPGHVPTLILLNQDDETPIAVLNAQRLRGTVSIDFDQPEDRVTLSLVPAHPNDRALVSITAPPKKNRTIGSSLAALSIDPMYEH